MGDLVKIPQRKARKFLPEEFTIDGWEALEPYYSDLKTREITSYEALYQWFLDRSELEAVVAEDLGWRYINMTRFTDNEDHSKAYSQFVQEIQPKIAPLTDKLNKKVIESPFLKDLEKEKGFDILIRSLKKDIEIFREENIALFTEVQTENQKYGQIIGNMTVEVDGQEMTLPQAAVLLQEEDRQKREEVYRKISSRRLQDKETLEQLFDKLIKLRDQIAKNAEFDNFRDYMFKSLGRFDYEPQDCFDFHYSVRTEIAPALNELALQRKKKLGLDQLKPWDKAVDPEGKAALKPFKSSKELTQKTIEVFKRLDPFLGQCLEIMREMGHLDLESRKGKAPGGYNYPLAEIGVPFIFMNATSTLRDMVTILHEGGHAVHSFLTRDLEISDFKNAPSEVAELASMSMELISMDEWDLFFDDEEELKRAKKEHLEQIIETLPWVATIDKFQHWIYENPDHT